jgi:hypothetical protein
MLDCEREHVVQSLQLALLGVNPFSSIIALTSLSLSIVVCNRNMTTLVYHFYIKKKKKKNQHGV